ncbi:Lysine-sensitive aspartokinase 3 [Polaribacter huanghezhanensis]|uniref:aspartate kinase n=1 Tax=Polaribacter huanghezhanensis TaxID=1354726 RepID=UPI0026498B8D|nr:aspartate kinase [Polaribacter huanghezhanensis]WKD85483.1 Lysine-sensitive aspartokinase 3 [Polaribacter huanghezhanensis]
MLVLKFGGTSVGNAENIKKVVEIITTSASQKIVVLSAVSGTTNSLLAISKTIQKKQLKQTLELIQLLENEYQILINELFVTNQYKDKALSFVFEKFNFLRSLTGTDLNLENTIVAQGEILSTHLVSLYLKESNISSTLISALDFMEVKKNNEPNISKIKEQLTAILNQKSTENLWITQGFICKNDAGEISNLQRGGSDYTASLIGAAVYADEIQIWTDIDGMHNNDPRFVENTFSLEEISFDEAAELAYFGAKILHPQSLIPAKENNINVLLKNTFSPLSKGTIIKNKTANNGFTAIAAKDGITAIKIKSYRMLMAYGFLKKVFEVFENNKTPIDMITTSEVAISLTVDDISYLSGIISELEPFGKINVDSDLSIICVAGDFSQKKEGISTLVFNALKNIPVRMISYGGSDYNISLLVKTTDKIAALNSLNNELFKEKYLLSEAIETFEC